MQKPPSWKLQASRSSIDGRGRAFDNSVIERLWRSVKHEHLYLHDHATVAAVEGGLVRYIAFYNTNRLHQSLAYQTPAEVYRGGGQGIQ